MKPLNFESEYDLWEIQDERIRLDPKAGESTLLITPDRVESLPASCA